MQLPFLHQHEYQELPLLDLRKESVLPFPQLEPLQYHLLQLQGFPSLLIQYLIFPNVTPLYPIAQRILPQLASFPNTAAFVKVEHARDFTDNSHLPL